MKHQWVVVATLSIDEDEIMEAHKAGEADLTFGPEKVMTVTPPVCLKCEWPWIEVHNKPCAGDPREARAAMELELELRALGDEP